MLQKNIKIILTVAILSNGFVSNACTIFMAADTSNVWIGNNEDELSDKKYRLWYYPGAHKDYGYMIWTELSIGKLFYGLMYLNPQGGLNDQGLFMDFTATDEFPIVKESQKKDRKKQIVTDILKKCKTVDEALTYLHQFNLVKLKYAQLFIGDASGNYATVTGGYIVRKTDNNFALTNYCINNGHKEACYRRDFANQFLSPGKTYQLEDIKYVLQKTSQKPPNNYVTNYSMAVNLKTKAIHLFLKNDFSTAVIINLTDELKRKKHHKDITDYFPQSLSNVLQEMYASNGIDAAITAYKDWRQKDSHIYNFKNHDAVDLAIQAIVQNNTKDAIKLLECLKEFEPGNMEIYSWLGVAYRRENNREESQKNFSAVLAQNPNDYLATLFGLQEHRKVIFRMNDFEGAEQVSLLGDFTEWKKKPIPMKKVNNVWTCEVDIPQGEYDYKFLVNKFYLADQINLMYTGTGPRIFSKLYVW